MGTEHLDPFSSACGATPCRGLIFALSLCERGVVDRLVRRIITNARERGAEAIVCACPLCQINLDGRQGEIKKSDGSWVDMPIIFLSQMVGRALGVSDEQLGLRKAMVNPVSVLP